MTSLEIAEVTGKQHKDVMRAIRNMEPAWMKVNGRNFSLVDYKDKKGELRPCYSLTKTECLYVATKFNDEARAKLVLRWKQLEEERQKEVRPMTDLDIMCRALLVMKRRIRQKEQLIANLQPKADYCDKVLDSVDCLTMTQVAKGLGMTAHDLTLRLLQDGIIYEQSGRTCFMRRMPAVGWLPVARAPIATSSASFTCIRIWFGQNAASSSSMTASENNGTQRHKDTKVKTKIFKNLT